MAELLSIADALALVLGRAHALDAGEVAVADAAGRFVAESATAPVDLPPFPSSAMDGFALRAADTPGTLRVAGRVAAGAPARSALEPHDAMAISTGGVVPDGADAVAPVEVVTEENGAVAVPATAPGANVRPRGSDIAAGAEVVAAGTRLGPAQLAALAAAGIAAVRCVRRPRVAVLPTGTELRQPGATLRAGEIYDSNGLMLAAQVATAGGEATRFDAVADDEAATRAAIERGLEADVLLTSGGVSVGEHDLVRRVEAELGVEEIFWGVAMRPGKPLTFGVRGRSLVFGLPGNPVSSFVCFELFVRPALLAMQGAADPRPRYLVGRLAAPARRNPRDSLLRARTRVAGDSVLLEPVTGQESHMIARAATADALVFVPNGEGELAAGAPVEYLQL
ncbi:MAG: molybdopterin molybdotransferase MoeA [Actinobacteria bacterium]|nr:molybdopterin molybdotransferase MoeA [Actinomycetota bacterium]